jgi:hypothetical protein
MVRRSIIILTSVAVVGGLCAAAAPPALEAAFHNTIVSTYPDGRQARLWLNKDGSYRAQGRRHDPSNGTWDVKGDQICLHQKTPATVPIAYCTAIPSGEVGSQWSAKSVFGDPLRVQLVAGR